MILKSPASATVMKTQTAFRDDQNKTFTLNACLNLQENKNRAKQTAESPSPLTWVRPIQEESVPHQCPPSTLRAIITDQLNPSGAGTTGPHPQVSCSSPAWTCQNNLPTVSSCLFSCCLLRSHAVSLQPADHAHDEHCSAHLRSLAVSSEPAAAAAAAPNWSSGGPAACVAVSAVRTI